VEEHHLLPVAEPTVVDRTFEAGKDFQYTLTVEVKPEVVVDGYLELEVVKGEISVSEEEVESRLKAVQDDHAQLKPLEPQRPVQEKDFIILDFEGSLAGKTLEGWNVKDHLVEVGSKKMVGDLDLQALGLSPNEGKDVVLNLPETYPQKELAGKEINIHLKVKEIKQKILPQLDDEFAKDVGEFKTLADLQGYLRQNLEKEKKNQADQAAREKILAALIEKHPFPIPPIMVERQAKNLIARTELRLVQQGIKLEESTIDRQKLLDTFKPAAEKEVRGSLILEKIAEMEKLSISEEEQEARLTQIAAQLNQRPEAVKSYYQKKNLLDDLRAQMLEEKTLDFLLSKAKMIERPSPSGTMQEEAGLEGKE
jgi:trigger factor